MPISWAVSRHQYGFFARFRTACLFHELDGPCPWALHAMHLLGDNTAIAFGVHLTVICDPPYTVGGRSPAGIRYLLWLMRPAILQLRTHSRILGLRSSWKNWKWNIERRLKLCWQQTQATHLDWHCLRRRWDRYLRVDAQAGQGLRTAMRLPTSVDREVQGQGLPTADYDFSIALVWTSLVSPPGMRSCCATSPSG